MGLCIVFTLMASLTEVLFNLYSAPYRSPADMSSFLGRDEKFIVGVMIGILIIGCCGVLAALGYYLFFARFSKTDSHANKKTPE